MLSASRIGRVGLAAAIASFAVHAQAEETPHFKGKTINLIISSAPGGGYDTYARLLIQHWGRHIPGNPDFVPRNMPGGGTLVIAASDTTEYGKK